MANENDISSLSPSEHERRLLEFCSATVNLTCRTVFDPSSVGEKTNKDVLPNFAANTEKSRSMNVGRALFCLELQSKNALIYQRYDATCHKMRESIETLRRLHNCKAKDESSTLTAHVDLGVACQIVSRWYNACFPLHARFRRVTQPIAVSAICSYKSDDFEIDASKRYLLVDNTEPVYWVVDSVNGSGQADGKQQRVPSLLFLVNWQQSDATELNDLLVSAKATLLLHFTHLCETIQSKVQQSTLVELKKLANLDTNSISQQSVIEVESMLRSYLDQRATNIDRFTHDLLRETYETANYYVTMPEAVQDRSEKYFKPPQFLLDSDSTPQSDRLVRMEWKMQIELKKQTTTVETTEIMPRSVDMALFKQSEQAVERKMAIRTVIDPTSDQHISLQEAVTRGIVVYRTGSYTNPLTGDSITISEAIMQQKIVIEEVAIEKMEEHNKSYGVLTVSDSHNRADLHYLIHAALDRKREDRVDFDTAVSKGLINLDNLTFTDTSTEEVLPIALALEKGFLKGRKLDNVNELEELKQSQSDIVKARVKRLTSSVSVIGELKRLTQHPKLHEA